MSRYELIKCKKRLLIRIFFIFVLFGLYAEYYFYFAKSEPPRELHMDFSMCSKYPNDLIENLAKTADQMAMNSIETSMGEKFKTLDHGGKSFNVANRILDGRVINRVAIIIPYRDRLKNLKIFLQYMHEFLIKQSRVNYAIYLIEPYKNLTFNRALLLNVGFRESLEDHDFECFIFHDVDMVPELIDNEYMCDLDYPKQFATAVSLYAYSDHDYFKIWYMGGVTGFTRQQFEKINGYSNSFFGWGGEDDDVYHRCMKTFGNIKRLDQSVGRYFANCHEIDEHENSIRYNLLKSSDARMSKDGLNSLNYTLLKKTRTKLFTLINVYY